VGLAALQKPVEDGVVEGHQLVGRESASMSQGAEGVELVYGRDTGLGEEGLGQAMISPDQGLPVSAAPGMDWPSPGGLIFLGPAVRCRRGDATPGRASPIDAARGAGCFGFR
jgi:hypothetical protein